MQLRMVASGPLLPHPLVSLLGSVAVLAAVMAAGYLVTALRARHLARQRADLLDEVGLLQTALLPEVPSVVGGVRVSVAYRPSDGPGAGGDFYDALTLPNGRAAFILGDVCGHGRQALARTAFVRYTLRAYLEAGLAPRHALAIGGEVVGEHMGGEFATVVLAVHDPAAGSLTYACAGHPPPLVSGPRRPEAVMVGSAPPVGLAIRTGMRQTTLPLAPGSVACLYTDGLAESRVEGRVLGRGRLGDLLDGLGRNATATGMLDSVMEAAHTAGDDMATMVITPMSGATAGGFRVEELELDPSEVADGLGARFLAACGCDEAAVAAAHAEIAAVLPRSGAVELAVTYGVGAPRVSVQSPPLQAGSGPTRTSILPVLAPSSRPMKAPGMFSMPSTTVSR